MNWWALNLVQGIFRNFVILVLDMQAQLKLETLTFLFLCIFLFSCLRNTFLAYFSTGGDGCKTKEKGFIS